MYLLCNKLPSGTPKSPVRVVHVQAPVVGVKAERSSVPREERRNVAEKKQNNNPKAPGTG